MANKGVLQIGVEVGEAVVRERRSTWGFRVEQGRRVKYGRLRHLWAWASET